MPEMCPVKGCKKKKDHSPTHTLISALLEAIDIAETDIDQLSADDHNRLIELRFLAKKYA